MTFALWIGIAAAVLVVVAHIALFLVFMGPDRTKKKTGDGDETNSEEEN